MDTQLVGFRIKECRLALGLTQTQLAEKLGKTRETISAYENGRVEPPSSIIYRVCSILKVSADFLLGLTDS